jgi:hypothetical protein
MTFDDYLLHVFYLFDTELEALNLTPRALRPRGPAPALCDSEVLTIEAAGEFLGIATDAGLYEHFCRYHSGEFPALPRVTRTTFLRQAANLWAVKRLLHERLLRRLPAAAAEDPLSIVDSFALHVCRFTRARKCRLFKGRAAYGFDAAEHHHFYGFRVHLRCSCQGACLAVELAPGNVADLPMVHELAPGPGGVMLADRNYWSPRDREALAREQGVRLLAPFRKRATDPTPLLSTLLGRLRERIETVNGQLAVRFDAKRTWARDLWHLCSRMWRKVLGHTAAFLINGLQGNPPLQLARLLEA